MILLDLFSGIGGFSKGFQDAGWKFDKHYYSDIDKHANAVYKYNNPEAIHVGDVKNVIKNLESLGFKPFINVKTKKE